MKLRKLDATDPWEWPEDAGEALLAALRDDTLDAADRELAARLAGDPVVVDDELFAELLRVLQDDCQPDEVRGSAAIALGPAFELAWIDEFESPDEVPISERMFDRARATLRAMYHDPDLSTEVRRRILEGAVRAPDDWHEEAVREAWRSDDRRWRLTAVFCMEYLGGFDEEILAALESDDEEVFYHAICAAGAQEVEDAWPYVAAVLESDTDDTDLVFAAIEAANLVGGDAARPYLADLLEDEDEEISDAAMHALRVAAILDPDGDDLGVLDFEGFDGLDDGDDELVH